MTRRHRTHRHRTHRHDTLHAIRLLRSGAQLRGGSLWESALRYADRPNAGGQAAHAWVCCEYAAMLRGASVMLTDLPLPQTRVMARLRRASRLMVPQRERFVLDVTLALVTVILSGMLSLGGDLRPALLWLLPLAQLLFMWRARRAPIWTAWQAARRWWGRGLIAWTEWSLTGRLRPLEQERPIRTRSQP